MITIEEGLVAFLKANAGVAALVSDRVHINKRPQDETIPSITFRRIDSPRITAHDTSGSGGTARPRFQFDCWGATYANCKAVSDAVRAALNGYRGTMGSADPVTVQSALIQDETYDDFEDAGMGRMSSDYIIWHLES